MSFLRGLMGVGLWTSVRDNLRKLLTYDLPVRPRMWMMVEDSGNEVDDDFT